MLRHADYREYDRMLTLLTPGGRVDALARGCRRPKSPLLPAAEVFTFGVFDLYQSRERCQVTACTVRDSFYPLRLDFDRLACAAYLANVCEAAAQPGEPAQKPFLLLARALGYLCYQPELPPRTVVSAFLLHFSAAIGYRPRLNHCAACGEALPADTGALFDIEQGGALCARCAGAGARGAVLTARQLAWLRESEKKGVHGELPGDCAPLELLMQYTALRLEKRVPPLMAKV